jgi:hypothetical protein
MGIHGWVPSMPNNLPIIFFIASTNSMYNTTYIKIYLEQINPRCAHLLSTLVCWWHTLQAHDSIIPAYVASNVVFSMHRVLTCSWCNLVLVDLSFEQWVKWLFQMLTDCFECLSSADYRYALARWELFESGLVKSRAWRTCAQKNLKLWSSSNTQHLLSTIHGFFLANFWLKKSLKTIFVLTMTHWQPRYFVRLLYIHHAVTNRY